MSKPGKSSGKYRYWLKVKDVSTGSLHSLDFQNIDKWVQKEEPYICKITSNTKLEQAKIAETTNLKEQCASS